MPNHVRMRAPRRVLVSARWITFDGSAVLQKIRGVTASRMSTFLSCENVSAPLHNSRAHAARSQQLTGLVASDLATMITIMSELLHGQGPRFGCIILPGPSSLTSARLSRILVLLELLTGGEGDQKSGAELVAAVHRAGATITRRALRQAELPTRQRSTKIPNRLP
jgi:hypothetical protein